MYYFYTLSDEFMDLIGEYHVETFIYLVNNSHRSGSSYAAHFAEYSNEYKRSDTHKNGPEEGVDCVGKLELLAPEHLLFFVWIVPAETGTVVPVVALVAQTVLICMKSSRDLSSLGR